MVQSAALLDRADSCEQAKRDIVQQLLLVSGASLFRRFFLFSENASSLQTHHLLYQVA